MYYSYLFQNVDQHKHRGIGFSAAVPSTGVQQPSKYWWVNTCTDIDIGNNRALMHLVKGCDGKNQYSADDGQKIRAIY